MTALNKSEEKSGLKKKHLIVVFLFILAATTLVLLTTFAISMLAATGDFNKLLIKRVQEKSDLYEKVVEYSNSGNPADKEAILDISNQLHRTDTVISEILSDSPDKDLIFAELSSLNIHPNEITGLIRIYTQFSGTVEVVKMKQLWAAVQLLSSENQTLMDLILNEEGVSEEILNTMQTLNMDINANIRNIIARNSDILLVLKRYSLWFTVLLGILIVLIGIIYTIRGYKQIQKFGDLLLERDALATFPELNQYPVLNITADGNLGYVNQAARSLFPDIEEEGLDHPFLSEFDSDKVLSKKGASFLEETEINGSYYQQSFTYLSDDVGIHVHSIDITKLKKQQQEISKSLHEKELLLAEVHHRVKNNMAIISGLLELQMMIGEDPQKALSESLSRIKSMSLVHEIVYKSDSFSEIDLEEFLQKISDHLRTSLSAIDKVTVGSRSILQDLNLNQAVPLGLLINEMAFYLCTQPALKCGVKLEMTLSITSEKDLVCLKISLPLKGIENPLKESDELPFRGVLIKNLLNQIGAELTSEDVEDTSFLIRFKPDSKKGASSSFL